jgi:uncharacterized protein (DUF4415 family)
MQKSGNIVSYTAEELRAMRERGEVHEPDWAYIDSLTEEELEASIDIEEEGAFDLDNAVVGVPMPKLQLTVHFDGDIIAWFKEQGPGYQTQMNEVLRSYVDAQKRKALAEARTKG